MNIISFEEKTFEGIAAKLKMLSALSGSWRIDARMPNGEVEPFDRV